MKETKAKVGAFWLLPGPRVIGEACCLAEAERTGDSYNGPTGHHWLWPKLIKPISLLDRAYTTVPRGRVLYKTREQRFYIYAAPEISKDKKARHAVEEFYGLLSADTPVSWKSDPHYVTQPDLLLEEDDFPAD